MNCIDEDTAVALIEGRAARSVHDHVAGCETCRRFIASLARVIVPESVETVGGWVIDEDHIRAGTRVKEYVIGTVLGRGGMGTVYNALDSRLARNVAIKFVRAGHRSSQIRREAATMAKLVHPNVVAVFDVGESRWGSFVVMEKVAGTTIRQWLAESRTADEIIHVFAQAGEGLYSAHRAGIVHGDFKPSNAMIALEGDVGRVKVLDFGLARFAPRRLGSRVEYPQRDRFGGTPRYAAPELVTEGPSKKSDQYSFCASLFEALAGYPPYPGTTLAERRTSMLRGRLRPLPRAVSFEVIDALEKGLSIDPNQRHDTMRSLVDALVRRRRRSRAWLIGVAAVATSVVLWPESEQNRQCAEIRDRIANNWVMSRPLGWGTTPQLEHQASKLEGVIDAWLETRDRICDVERRKPLRTLAGERCLERLARRIEATSVRLREIDTQRLPIPASLFQQLEDPTRCLQSSRRPLVHEGLRRDVEAYVDHASTAFERPDTSEDVVSHIRARGGELLVQAREVADPQLQALILQSLANVDLQREAFDDAERTFEEAFFMSLLAEDAHLSLAISIEATRLLVDVLSQPSRVSFWAEQATAAAEKVGTPTARGRAALVRAKAAAINRSNQEAIAELDLALLSLRETEWEGPVLLERSRAHANLRQWSEARTDAVRAIEAYETEWGPTHPSVAAPLSDLVGIEFMEENYEAGLLLSERAIALMPLQDRVGRAMARGNIALIERRLGRLTEAHQTFRTLVVEFEELLGPEHRAAIQARLSAVELQIQLGRRGEARDELDWLLERGLEPGFLSRALLLRASVSRDPRPDLERVLQLPDISDKTKKEVRERLDALVREHAESR